MGSLARRFMLLFASLLLLLLIGECTQRLRQRSWRPFFGRARIGELNQPDRLLGWRVRPDLDLSFTSRDASGRAYQVRFRTTRGGFRCYGDPASERTKLLVLGDSFTFGSQVSNDRAYFAVMAELLGGCELFVYGGGGYGSLQELLVLEESIDAIDPDLILWQWCSNDFVNNSYELESRSVINNNATRRPYLSTDGRLVYRDPKRLDLFPNLLLEHSRLCLAFDLRIQRAIGRVWRDSSVEREIERAGRGHEGLRQAAAVTDLVFQRLCNRVGTVPISTFSADSAEPWTAEYEELARRHGLLLIDGVARSVVEAEQRGAVVRAADRAHWNELGHRLVGERLADHFRKSGVGHEE